MKLFSPDFKHKHPIPSRFTCEGEDVSPALSWKGAPDNAKSFALTVIDPDAPGGEFIHWLVYDIPKKVNEMPWGVIPPGAKEVENDFGKTRYGGPCPPSGEHRYVFTLYALDVERLEGVKKSNFIELVKKHAIASAELIGLYKKSK